MRGFDPENEIDPIADFYINGNRVSSSSVSFPGNIFTETCNAFISDGTFSAYVICVNVWGRYNWIYDDIEQVISERYSAYLNGGFYEYSDIPVSLYLFGDGKGSIPAVMKRDISGEWDLLCIGNSSTGAQRIDTTVSSGISGIRLFSKYTKDAKCNFDQIASNFGAVSKVKIEKKYKRVIDRIILQTKPIFTWAVELIEWI